MTTTTKPIDHVRLGSINAAIWKNTDGGGRVRYSVTFERRYLDKDGNWQSTTGFGRDELLTLAKVADLAHTRVHEQQASDRAAAQAASDRKQAQR
ncbi:MAG: hypothetical protein ACIAQ0_09190 [Phycisphaerales bacterium JB058]